MSLPPDAEHRIRQRVGTVVRGKYRLDRLLGVGGMAAVFEATHRNGSRAALKMLHPELARLSDIRSRFLREGYVANRVGHPGVTRVMDDDDDDGGQTVFLVLELLEGETLEARCERLGGRLPLGETLFYADALLDVLGAAHDQGIVHRDIKPDNLFVTNQGELKVLDFGIARLLDGTGATRSGDLLGTPAFMAPEQANGRIREIDGRTDLWSVGAVMFTLLTGSQVHVARTAPEQMIYAATQQARPVESLAPWLAADIALLINRALAFDRNLRWPAARTMQGALRVSSTFASFQRTASGPAPAIPTQRPAFADTVYSPPNQAVARPHATLVGGPVSSPEPPAEVFDLKRRPPGR